MEQCLPMQIPAAHDLQPLPFNNRIESLLYIIFIPPPSPPPHYHQGHHQGHYGCGFRKISRPSQVADHA